jgi:hypothetical protein
MRPFLRLAAVLVLAAYGFAVTLPDVVVVWRPLGTYGLTTDPAGIVRSVAPDSPAARAGIQSGDKVEGLASAPLPEVWVASPGIARMVSVTHAGITRRVTLTSEPTKLAAGGAIIYPVGKLLGAFFIIAGLLLLLARPSPATWGFFLYCVGANPFEGWYLLGAAMPPKLYLACSLVDDVMNAAGIVGLVLFALYFPRLTLSGWRVRASRFVPLLFVFTAALNVAVDLATWFAKPARWVVNPEDLWFDLLFFAAAALFLETYLRTSGADRERLAWATFGMVVGMIGLIVADVYGLFSWSVFSSATLLERLTPMLVGVVPISIIYAAFHYRVLDFSLAVNRTLVYGAMTSLVVIIFALLHSLVARTIVSSRLGIVTELIAAIAIGFQLHAIHGRMATLVDRVFFRQRYSARRRIEEAAAALEYAPAAHAVDDILAGEPYCALELQSSAVFRGDGQHLLQSPHAFVRRCAYGWDNAAFARFEADDLLVLRLQAERRPLGIADVDWSKPGLPQGAAAPQFAVPIMSGRKVLGVAFYGGHRSGSPLDSDEAEIISRLARAAGQTYERLEADDLRKFIRERLGDDWRIVTT